MSGSNYPGQYIVNPKAIELAQDVNYSSVYFACRSGTVFNNLVIAPQLELGSTATAYEPYTSTTYTVSLSDTAGTVYGGTLDVTTGELVVDTGILTFNGSENWQVWTAGKAYYVSVGFTGGNNQVMTSNMFNWVGYVENGSQLVNQAVGSFACNCYNTGNWNGNISFKYDENADNLSGFKTFLASNPLQVTYKLITPQTYQLTPTEVTTLLGDNTIWMDADGTIDAEYWRLKQ